MINSVNNILNNRETCLNEGGDLIVVTDIQTQDYLRDWLKVYKKSFWIGLSDIVREIRNF